MEVKIIIERTVGDLIEYAKENFLHVNSEYQRGLRWKVTQKEMFIDSIFRGYSIPAFYLHKKEKSVGEHKNINFDIVDGQQRIEAIQSFYEGVFATFDPSCNSKFQFPFFFKEEPCEWGGKKYSELSDDLKNKFRNHKVVVYEIDTENENEIRDLFIRLQGGTPLTDQEKRDSWPGNFTEFVLNVGGKPEEPKWPGHKLFTEIFQSRNKDSSRRALVAQTFMLYWSIGKEKKFCDLKSQNLDDFYHSQVGFDQNSKEVKRFMKICDVLYENFKDQPKIYGHHIIHLILLTNELMNEYVSGTWESKLSINLYEFNRRITEARKAKDNHSESQYKEYLDEYGDWTSRQTDNASNIRRRHAFFSDKMNDLIEPKKKDDKRHFSDLERQIVFFRDKQICQYCRMNNNENHKVSWNMAEIHHVDPHAKGGETSIKNAALVHKDCHPKIKHEVDQFQEWFDRRKN